MSDDQRRRPSAIMRLNALMLGAGVLSLLPMVDVRAEQAIARLSLALDMPPLELYEQLTAAAKSSRYSLTPERLDLWADAVLAGETGLTEILIAIDPGPASPTDLVDPNSAVIRSRPVGKTAELEAYAAEHEGGVHWVAGPRRPRLSERPAVERRAKQLSKLGRW